ncbi:lysozyme [Clostridium beijerinckii]|uniref:lysozyme n=1 Tax=Clostridium beijerinckii TaxID=1520 RepID=UPI001494346E|nr:lysozyme [Clostridium beijerinckii]NOW85908.1 lysozyme [Clostridium beijerinckii]
MAKWQWCLVGDNGTLLKGWQRIGDYWYYLNPNGAMAAGWIQLDNKWYYLDSTGRMLTGWLQLENKWYYLNSDGSMYCSGTYTIDGKKQTFNDKGEWQESLLSDNGAKFIGSWEGFYDHAYADPYYGLSVKEYWTIGYGTCYCSIPDAFPNNLDSTCTEEQAVAWLKQEAKNCAETIKVDLDSKGVSLNQNQLDALISFAYNCGTDALLGSTLYRNIVAGIRDADTLRVNFQAWSKANGQTSVGLLKRREAEAALFLNADYTGNN